MTANNCCKVQEEGLSNTPGELAAMYTAALEAGHVNTAKALAYAILGADLGNRG